MVPWPPQPRASESGGGGLELPHRGARVGESRPSQREGGGFQVVRGTRRFVSPSRDVSRDSGFCLLLCGTRFSAHAWVLAFATLHFPSVPGHVCIQRHIPGCTSYILQYQTRVPSVYSHPIPWFEARSVPQTAERVSGPRADPPGPVARRPPADPREPTSSPAVASPWCMVAQAHAVYQHFALCSGVTSVVCSGLGSRSTAEAGI